ncbi:hypothetical protein F511_12837 [Dorcoceras hygrometricum]|uniref:Uncharacterized protein n=1 Tax=Dorcoceras hygrometricum TaxID=472368 RepID=A0A2Z7C8Y3_9LAMI|nr:hypothetical protein F511_12837 [Dorcoceras hygrometricum]
MKHEFRLLNDIFAKAITVKADMVDRSQKKVKGFAAQIGVLLKGIPAITMGDGVPFPSAKVLSKRTVHTYIVTNTTIDARTESEEPGMAKTPKAKKKPLSADEMPVDMFAEFTASKKRSAAEADAPIITKKRRTGKSKPSVSQAKLDIVQVATDVEPIQIVDPTHVEATVPSPVLKRKSRKRRLVLSRDSDDESGDSPLAVSPHHASSSSSTDVSLHFDSSDVPVHAQAATHAPASVEFTKLSETLEDVQSSLAQRIHDSNCEMLSKLNSVGLGVRGDLLKMQSLLRQSFETACRVLERK